VNMVKAVSPLRGGKLHCLLAIYSNRRRETTKIYPSANFSSNFEHGLNAVTRKAPRTGSAWSPQLNL